MIWALHGAFGGPSDWDDLAAALDHEIRPIDLWSPEHDLPLPDWGRAFNRMVSETDTEPVLLGYSMGARLGLHALLGEAGSWRSAILVSAHPGLLSQDERDARRAGDEGWLRLFDELEWPEFRAAWNAQGILESAASRGLSARRHEMRRGLAIWSLSKQRDLRPDLWRIECPVLWVTGGRDRKFTALGEAAVPLLPQASHSVVDDAGHRVPWDAPAAFAGLVRGFACA